MQHTQIEFAALTYENFEYQYKKLKKINIAGKFTTVMYTISSIFLQLHDLITFFSKIT